MPAAGAQWATSSRLFRFWRPCNREAGLRQPGLDPLDGGPGDADTKEGWIRCSSGDSGAVLTTSKSQSRPPGFRRGMTPEHLRLSATRFDQAVGRMACGVVGDRQMVARPGGIDLTPPGADFGGGSRPPPPPPPRLFSISWSPVDSDSTRRSRPPARRTTSSRRCAATRSTTTARLPGCDSRAGCAAKSRDCTVGHRGRARCRIALCRDLSDGVPGAVDPAATHWRRAAGVLVNRRCRHSDVAPSP